MHDDDDETMVQRPIRQYNEVMLFSKVTLPAIQPIPHNVEFVWDKDGCCIEVLKFDGYP